MKKCIVMLSGGLDSRLVVKLMKEKGKVVAVFFKLPFAKDNEKEVNDFLKEQKVELKFFDCTRGRLLKEYLDVIKNAKFGRGAGVNPCIDCKIFMFKKAREFADKNKIEVVTTGEVEGQRPMSQMKKSLKLIEEKSGLKGRLIRPLSELGILGRRRDKQIALAKKFKIFYPSPAGGCVLCEKELKKRFGESKVVTDILDKLKEMSSDIDKFKRRSNEFHLKIQNRAKESQELHESIITSSKEIDKIKEEEEQAFGKFIEFKKKFTEANDLLKDKLTKMNGLMKSLASLKLKKGEEKKLEEDIFLKNKEAEVEEKIKKGGKLTTEDLLVFQKDNSKI